MLFSELCKNGGTRYIRSRLWITGIKQVEKTAHGLQQHHVVGCLRNRQMKSYIGLRGEVGVIALGRFKAEADFSLSASVARIAAYQAVLASMA